jgi:hypothetical protein
MCVILLNGVLTMKKIKVANQKPTTNHRQVIRHGHIMLDKGKQLRMQTGVRAGMNL